jgi:hypothetical protein
MPWPPAPNRPQHLISGFLFFDRGGEVCNPLDDCGLRLVPPVKVPLVGISMISESGALKIPPCCSAINLGTPMRTAVRYSSSWYSDCRFFGPIATNPSHCDIIHSLKLMSIGRRAPGCPLFEAVTASRPASIQV